MTADAAPTLRPKRRRAWLVFALLLFLAACAGSGVLYWRKTTPPDPPAVATEGLDPAVSEAIDEARAEVLKSPRSGPAWGTLGMVYFAHGYAAEARMCLYWAGQREPKNPRWPYLEALTLVNDPDRCLPLLRRAVELAPEEPGPRLRLAEMLLELGLLDEAESKFRHVLETRPDDPRAHNGLGRVAYQRNDLDGAKDHLQYALARAPQARAIHALLAEVHIRQENPAAADRELRLMAGAVDDFDWPDPWLDEVDRLRAGVGARIALAEKYHLQGRGNDAVVLLDQLVQANPDSYEAHAARGWLLMRLGNLPAAEGALGEALRLKPDSVEAQCNLALVLENRGAFADAAVWFRKAIASKPMHAPAHYHLGLCLLKLNQPTAAERAFRDAVRCRPDFAEAHRDLGWLLAETGKMAEARTELEQAVSLAPGDEVARKMRDQLRGPSPPP
jgi:Flp pilus assembly protein TadD